MNECRVLPQEVVYPESLQEEGILEEFVLKIARFFFVCLFLFCCFFKVFSGNLTELLVLAEILSFWKFQDSVVLLLACLYLSLI